jgi:GNAT superfamily N-acetyltransferase
MAIAPDDIATNMCDAWERMFELLPIGWAERRAGVMAGVTGFTLPPFNSIMNESTAPDVDVFADLLDRVAGAGFPYSVQLRPGTSKQVRDLVDAKCLVIDEGVPLMVLDDPRALSLAQRVEGLTIRQLDLAETGIHAEICGAVFGLPEEVLAAFNGPEVLGAPGVRCYVGEFDGVAVTTGLGTTYGAYTGIFNIATPEEFRGRGYAAALTARAVTDGLDAGAVGSYLQSSPAGYHVYERLGFQTVEYWDCWHSAA